MERYRIYSDGAVYFVTFSVVEWLPVFVSEGACQIISESLDFCHYHKELRTNSYVVMPTHFHAILFRSSFNPDAFKAALTDFRKFTARRLIDYCHRCMPSCFDRVFQRFRKS